MSQRYIQLYLSIIVTCFIACQGGFAQEPLTTILERGFPAQWYVCGPFDSDLENGIIDALKNDQSPLGRNDFMASEGGVTQVQPRHGQVILKEGGEATWLKTRASSSTIDLSPFFPKQESGIAFASFYATTLVEQAVLMEIQSVLGVRVFLNGKEVKDLPASPLSVAGNDVFQANFQPGSNVLLIEVPGASLVTMAEAFSQPMAMFQHQHFSNRTNVQVNTGFELDVRMEALTPFQGISFSKTLRSTGTFSGKYENIFQDAWLTLYNPANQPSPTISYTASMPGATPRVEMEIPSIPPKTRIKHRLALPVASRIPGRNMRVDSALTIKQITETWSSSIPAEPVPQYAQHHALIIPSILNSSLHDQATRTEQYRTDLSQSIQRVQETDEYGFTLGTVDQWLPILSAYPEYRSALISSLKSKAVSPWSTYTTLDHRIAGGETLARNLLYGDLYTRTWLDAPQSTYWGWNMPSFSPQLPQLLDQLELIGGIHNLPYEGLPSLYRHQGRDASSMLFRRKGNSPLPKTLLDVHDIAKAQHREWAEEGIDNDLQVYENIYHALETFWVRDNLPLSKAIPPIKVRGEGAELYFNGLSNEFSFTQRPTAWVSRDQRTFNAIDILQNPVLLKHNAHAERQLLSAEMWGSFAAMSGAEYPFNAMNDAWKQLLYLTQPEGIAQPQTTHNYLDALQQYRTIQSTTKPVIAASLNHLASQVNTDNNFVAGVPGAQAIVVYNPSNWERNDYVEMRIELNAAEGLSILNASGLAVPFDFKDLHIKDRRLEAITVRFLANAVPSLGYTTYYAVPQGALEYPTEVFTPYIENEFFQIEFDNGEISRIVDRRGLLPEISDTQFNDIVAYHLDPDAPETLWTGDSTRASKNPSKVVFESFPLGQRATIVTPFKEGEVHRRVTLYDGLARIDFDLELKNLEGFPALWGAEFSPIHPGLTPLNGHQFGSMFGRADTTTEAFRADPENTALPVMNTASSFHAATVAPYIDVEGTFFEALRPATIIHSGASADDKLAKELQTALTFRGIPSVSYSQLYREPSTVWRDDTLPANLDEDLGQDTFFRILIGHPKHNQASKDVFGQFSEETRENMEALFGEGKAVFLFDNHVPFGHAPLPTLVLAGDTLSSTRAVVEEATASVRDKGRIDLTRAQYLPTEGHIRPSWSGAILHQENALNAIQNNHWMHFFYNSLKQDPELEPNVYVFNYALYPYAGVPATSDVEREAMAYSRPLLASQVPVQSGLWASTGSFLKNSGDNFILTSIAPRVPEETLFALSQPFMDALIVRGYEHRGINSKVNFSTKTKMYGVAELNSANVELSPVRTVTGDINVELGAYAINSMSLYPTPGSRSETPPKLLETSVPTPPMFTRSWMQNSGVASGSQQALTVRIQEPLPSLGGEVHIHIANNSLHTAFTGELTTQISSGWKLSDETTKFYLEPNAQKTIALTVTQENREHTQWSLLAQVDHDGLSILDVASNYDYPVEVNAENRENKFLVSIRNGGGLPVVGHVELITQLDTSHSATQTMTVLSNGIFRIPSYQEERVLFTCTAQKPPDWAYAKVVANGQVHYVPISMATAEEQSHTALSN